MMSDAYARSSEHLIGKYFKCREFDCPCVYCDTTLIHEDLVKGLDKMREMLSRPIYITSGYRCDRYQHNLRVRGYETARGISTHQLGYAADISTGEDTGLYLEEIARKCGFRAVGVGPKWVHVDTRSDKDRAWSYQTRTI